MELTELVETAPRTTVEQLDAMLAAGEVTLVDIRNPGERDLGTIPVATPIPLAQLRTRLASVPTGKPIVVYCAGGWRFERGCVTTARTRVRERLGPGRRIRRLGRRPRPGLIDSYDS